MKRKIKFHIDFAKAKYGTTQLTISLVRDDLGGAVERYLFLGLIKWALTIGWFAK